MVPIPARTNAQFFERVNENIDSGDLVDIYLDFQKTFDKAPCHLSKDYCTENLAFLAQGESYLQTSQRNLVSYCEDAGLTQPLS